MLPTTLRSRIRMAPFWKRQIFPRHRFARNQEKILIMISKLFPRPSNRWALTLLLTAALANQAMAISYLDKTTGIDLSFQLPKWSAGLPTIASVFVDGTSAGGEITVVKKALLNGEPVDEVCGGQVVTFQYTVTNHITEWPASPPIFPNPVPADPLYFVNIDDSDPALGDIDGTVSGVTINPGASVTFTKTKTIAIGETSSSTMTVTGNYALSQSPSDAVSATDTWTVTGISCEVSFEKRVNGGALSGQQAFTFQVRTGASVNSVGTTISTAIANAANGGNVGIASLQLNTQYQFCETNLLPGWTTSLSQIAGSFVPNSAGGNPDNGVVCINFTVNPDGPTTFYVNNSTPVGGPARTIGYWKNWSSCSPGKQSGVLDYVLSTFGSGPAIPPDPLPNPLPSITTGLTFGSLQINSCQRAVNILDKSTIGGVKKASHPAYNMAAQLLAVKLNIQAGADPKCLGPYIVEAEQLLLAVNFNGMGTPTYAATQGARMNVLASYFDRYNNGDPNLCPAP